ncbi:hypothetical protein [Bizionia paragorgiae]|uniref:hypothetical protein n=1 Tax=Bizionia paragorgiae TaxID=283786 RepID=UPI000B869298|nr:hypothetical protein [Bizionia paragorgiae]
MAVFNFGNALFKAASESLWEWCEKQKTECEERCSSLSCWDYNRFHLKFRIECGLVEDTSN